MIKVLIENDYRVTLPTEIQDLVPVGSTVSVTIDETGRIILIPESQVQAILMETFGMWTNRDDLTDGVVYMDDIRQGQRLNSLGLTPDETD